MISSSDLKALLQATQKRVFTVTSKRPNYILFKRSDMVLDKNQVNKAAEMYASHPTTGPYELAIINFKAGVQWAISQKFQLCPKCGWHIIEKDEKGVIECYWCGKMEKNRNTF